MKKTEILNKEDIQKTLLLALENKEKTLRSALVGKPLVYIIDEKFADKYMNSRKEKGIHLKSLRFTQDQVDLAKHTSYSSFNKEVRVAPSNIKIEHSILIWDDKVAVINTEKISGDLTEDQENANSIKKWFNSKYNNNSPMV